MKKEFLESILKLLIVVICVFFISCKAIDSNSSSDDEKQIQNDELSNDSNLITDISVFKKPTKLVYLVGEDFDQTGMIIKLNYISSPSKDITDKVTISGFDSSREVSYQKITVSYDYNGTIYTAFFYVDIKERPFAEIPYDKNREVKVTFQYYYRENISAAFQEYKYSDDPYDDINGSIVFKIDKHGMMYSVDNIDFKVYKYYPSNLTGYIYSYDFDGSKIKNHKYIGLGNKIITSVEENTYTMPWSYLFTSNNSNGLYEPIFDYGTSSEIANTNAKTLIFEDYVRKTYREDRLGRLEHIFFKGVEYPIFEEDDKSNITKAVLFSQENNFFVCILTMETELKDPEIEWPISLWGIDHFE